MTPRSASSIPLLLLAILVSRGCGGSEDAACTRGLEFKTGGVNVSGHASSDCTVRFSSAHAIARYTIPAVAPALRPIPDPMLPDLSACHGGFEPADKAPCTAISGPEPAGDHCLRTPTCLWLSFEATDGDQMAAFLELSGDAAPYSVAIECGGVTIASRDDQGRFARCFL